MQNHEPFDVICFFFILNLIFNTCFRNSKQTNSDSWICSINNEFYIFPAHFACRNIIHPVLNWLDFILQNRNEVFFSEKAYVKNVILFDYSDFESKYWESAYCLFLLLFFFIELEKKSK